VATVLPLNLQYILPIITTIFIILYILTEAYRNRKVHKHSLIKALQAIFPEHNLKTWKFKRVSLGYWSTTEDNVEKEFLESVKEELNVKSIEDWYTLTVHDIKRVGGGAILYPKDLLIICLSSIESGSPIRI
jgi:hypothetical protein